MSELERATMADLQERELARLRSDLAGMALERDRWREDSLIQAKTIQRLADAATDRNKVDAKREMYHAADLAAMTAQNAAMREALRDAERRLLGAGMLGSERGDPVRAALALPILSAGIRQIVFEALDNRIANGFRIDIESDDAVAEDIVEYDAGIGEFVSLAPKLRWLELGHMIAEYRIEKKMPLTRKL